MQPDDTGKQEPESNSPDPAINPNTNTNPATKGWSQSNGKPAAVGLQNSALYGHQFPPPKTDKPRPHGCHTCGRSFARLEHLKRHERSHTKEKPFECPECTRCFARRDLLLRHQQKLHITNATTRPRQGRRESVSGATVAPNARVRKSLIANANLSGLATNHVHGRPRANTISHIDMASLGLFDGSNPDMSRMNTFGLDFNHTVNLGNLPSPGTFDYRGMPVGFGQQGNADGLPKLDTHPTTFDVPTPLRTAPPQASFGGFDMDQLFTPHTTVNPAALHYGGAGSIPSSNIPFGFDPSTNQHVPTEDDFGWMRNWNMHMSHGNDHDQAVEESSPSRISSGDSPGDLSERMTNSQACLAVQQPNTLQWQHQPEIPAQQTMMTNPFQLDTLGSGLPNLDGANGTVSPSTLHDPMLPTPDAYFPQPVAQHRHRQSHPDVTQGQNGSQFGHPRPTFGSNSPSVCSSSITTGSARQSSVTSMSTDSITDSTRQALLNSLSQPPNCSEHGQRKYSQPNVNPTLPAAAGRGSMSSQGPSLPRTAAIRRYVDAFIHYAHPHLPLAHLPTLSFNGLDDIAATPRGSPPCHNAAYNTTHGGARCLLLGMAAIGALYEYDHPASKDLFETAKKMISFNLEERRKADMATAVNGSPQSTSETPLWLVQAMLLTVIYGHYCGDRLSADIASNHIAALVSLARAANLARPPSFSMAGSTGQGCNQQNRDVEMGEPSTEDLQTQWMKWKTVEERKRCLFAIFFMSSLLTTAYNQTPTIMNSEILLDLPCSEELFNAKTPQEWQTKGGLVAIETTSISFATALSTLLTANQRQGNKFTPSAYNSSSAMNNTQIGGEETLRPSTFGCLVLIAALHNYIWETRSRHRLRDWTVEETESMVAHVEPALNAWQAAWKANEHHKLERPNPYGFGPLSADSIPLLDLAFVRLYVNLGRTAEAFWRRDFDAMAEELSSGADTVGFQETRKDPNGLSTSSSLNSSLQQHGMTPQRGSQLQSGDTASLRRERHLRKAAFYALDSLTIACSYNLIYTDATAHELPIQSAICFLDCTQVIAEWCTTVQERVGPYLGVLGRDLIDYSQVPAIILLEAEDVELLRKIEQICHSLEDTRMQQETLLVLDMTGFDTSRAANSMANGVNLNTCSIGSKVLRVVAKMLEKAVIWPITHVMAKALECEASHMDRRSTASCAQC